MAAGFDELWGMAHGLDCKHLWMTVVAKSVAIWGTLASHGFKNMLLSKSKDNGRF